MDRIVRDRGSVGRRIWRRRKRRPAGDGAPPQEGAPAEQGPWPEGADDADDPPPRPLPKKRGFLASLFARSPAPPPPDPPYLVVDPTREVLAVPRGAARLDAFERALKTTPSGTPQFRALALAFHKELQALTEGAGVDLSLFETRVEACAQALIAAGDEERAGTLFLKVGRRHRAAELFVKAGAIDALEEAHAQIRWDEGGPKSEARSAFDRFEALFLVGMRELAFASLERAHKLWSDNAIYSEVYASFMDRLGKPRVLTLTSGRAELVVLGGFPVVIGRGEDAGVRLTSPLISRAHLKIELEDGRPVVVDLESRGGTRIGGAPLVGRRALPDGAAIDMAGVVVETRASAGALWLQAALAPERRTLAALGPLVQVPGPASDAHSVTVRFDGHGRAVVDAPAVVNAEPVRRSMMLLAGDRLSVGAMTWIVVTGHRTAP